MFLFGIGFRNTSQRKYGTKEKEDSNRIYCIDETLLKVSHQFVGVWIAIDSNRRILGIRISVRRTILITERFGKKYGKHPSII